MKSVAYSLVVAASLATTSAFAAEMAVKAPPPAPPPSPWDVVVTAALMNDYNFRGVTQSNHRPSTQAGFEGRYNWNANLQSYAGVSGESIDFPNRAAAEIDFYGGIRPTFDKLALDFGGWYYYYPDGQCFGPVAGAASCSALGGGPSVAATLPNGNVVKQNANFYEWYGKATYTVNDNFNFGGSIWYSPSVLNYGAYGVYYAGNVTFTAPTTWFTNGVGAYASADVGYWDLGTSDLFYAAPPAFPAGVPYTKYTNWDAGVGFTWKVLTLDLRYYDSNLTKAECNVFTSDHTATGPTAANTTPQNPGGLGSNWCGAAFIAKLSASVDFNSNLK
ncbi:MAG: TorF family putative porin [Xanthobacteraceae bacterium]